MKPKVLLVEDDVDIVDMYMMELAEEYDLLLAPTKARARELLAANPDTAAIVMDGRLHSPVLNTSDLTREFRRSFRGPIIANAANRADRMVLCEAGCSHETEKSNLLAVLQSALAAA